MAKPRVLYVDDEQALLELTQIFLADSCQVDIESNPLNALARLKGGKYDVIISDYQMSGMDGIDLLKELRAMGDETPFILFTGKGREEVAMDALNNGADFYLQKGGRPTVQFGELRNAILQLNHRKDVERSLSMSERRYRDLVEGANLLILKIGLDGRVTYMNPYGLRFFGIDASLIGAPLEKLISNLVVADDVLLSKIKELMVQPLKRAGHTNTHPLTLLDGRTVWLSWSSSIIGSETGEMSELMIIGSDVTMVKRIELELQRSMSLTQATLESSDEGIIVLGFDGRVLTVNRKHLEMWGIQNMAEGFSSRKEMEGFLLSKLKDPQAYIEHMMRARTSGISVGTYILELADGRTFQEYTAPFMIGKDSVGLYCSYKDITGLRALERAIRERDEQRSRLIDAIPDLVICTDDHGTITFANERTLERTGYARDEVIGKNVLQFVSPEDAERAAAHLRDPRGVPHRPFQYRLRMKDGSTVVFEAHSNIMRKVGNGPEEHVIVVRDISDHARLESALREANAKLRILSSVSRHDSVNKLMAIRGFLELAKRRTGGSQMNDQIDRMSGLVDLMLQEADFIKEYQNMGASNPEWQSVKEVFARAAAGFISSGLTFHGPADGVKVYADPMLGKVFCNLIDNSLKHGQSVNNISLEQRQADSSLIIIYRDDGAGISEKDRSLLFKEGYGRDHGLGLFLAKEILAITGMSIVETGEAGKGARFEIRVPPGSFLLEKRVEDSSPSSGTVPGAPARQAD